jgi:DNA-binding LacI/PurR family transcriptional regulator
MKLTAKDKVKVYMRQEALKPESAFKMPTMRELTKRLHVSLGTVTGAIKELEMEGLVTCRQGSGIVATRPCASEAILGSTAKNERGSLVLAVVDYPSDIIWTRVYMLEQYARRQGFGIVNCKVQQDTEPAEIIAFAKQQSDCSGLVLMLGAIQLEAAALEAFGKLSIPVVLVHSMFSYPSRPDNIYTINPDPEAAGTLVGEYLHGKGHRNIGLIRNEPATEYSDRYRAAVAATLRQPKDRGKLHYFPSVIRNWGDALKEARLITRDNLAKIRDNGITALIYLSSHGAFAALPDLFQAGFRIPEDLSVIASANGWFCDYSRPAITATAVDCQAMCFRAVDILADEKYRKKKIYKIRESLHERASVSNPRQLRRKLANLLDRQS